MIFVIQAIADVAREAVAGVSLRLPSSHPSFVGGRSGPVRRTRQGLLYCARLRLRALEVGSLRPWPAGGLPPHRAADVCARPGSSPLARSRTANLCASARWNFKRSPVHPPANLTTMNCQCLRFFEPHLTGFEKSELHMSATRSHDRLHTSARGRRSVPAPSGLQLPMSARQHDWGTAHVCAPRRWQPSATSSTSKSQRSRAERFCASARGTSKRVNKAPRNAFGHSNQEKNQQRKRSASEGPSGRDEVSDDSVSARS